MVDMALDAAVTQALDRFATRSRVLVASDFDGVIAPIVDDPAAVVPITRSLAALEALSLLDDTEAALVSGRSLAFLRALDGVPASLWLAGSHGSEFGHRTPAPLEPARRDLLDRLVADLRMLASAHEGALVEEKSGSVAFHYRNVDPAARADIASIIVDGPGALAGVEVKRGKMVLELAVFSANKGTAIEALRADTSATAVFYIGDDITDEDAFAVLHDGDLGIKVGPGVTRATHRIASPHDAMLLLTHLAAARAAAHGRSAPGVVS